MSEMDRKDISERILAEIHHEEIQPFKGRIPPGLGRSMPGALLFKITCHCGVTAMLSVDVPSDAGEDKIGEMIPHLADALDRQAEQFRRIPCDAHSRMSMG